MTEKTILTVDEDPAIIELLKCILEEAGYKVVAALSLTEAVKLLSKSHFDLIIPCGIFNKRPTSLQRLLDKKISVDEIKKPLVEHFVDVFGFDTVHKATPKEIASPAQLELTMDR